MSLEPGTRLGPYEILAPLGAGGMGEVYRARDTRLQRSVAIKLLPEHLAANAELRQRLEREARAISSLNHPHICALYDVGSREGTYYLVMEHLEGETLAARLAGGAVPLREALRMAQQIAGALEAAHEKGVLHRDLKPSNVHVGKDGTVKLLDFGLAKTQWGLSGPEVSSAPTRTGGETREGTIVGSPAYMSPEQARGKPVDRQADVWSFGCLLYELLAGRPAFRGETVSDILAAVLDREPSWEALPGSTPAGIRHLLARCLEKDAGRRLRDIREVRLEIEQEIFDLDHPRPRTPKGLRPAWMAITLIAAAALVAVAILREERRPDAVVAPALAQVTFAKGVEEFPAWSPDGTKLLYSAEAGGLRKIFLLDLETGAADPLTGGGDFDEIQPAWTSDGGSVLFVRARDPGARIEPWDVFGPYEGGNLWRLDLETGEEVMLVEEAFGPSPSPDGTRIAVDASWIGPRRIWLLDEMGRNPVQLTSDASEAVSHVRPRWSAGGESVVFQKIDRTRFDIGLAHVDSGTQVDVTDDFFLDLHPAWSPSGRFIYFSSYRSGGINIWRIPVAPDGTPSGRPQQLTSGAGQDVEIALSPGGDRIAFSILKQNADLCRLPVSPEGGRPVGPVEEVVATTREESRGAWSPDGTRIAFNADRAGAMNIWLHDLGEGSTRQITMGPGGDFQPNWSPDGKRLAFFSSRAGNADIWTVDLDTGALEQLTTGTATDVNPFHSPDGRRIAYQSDEEGRLEVWVMNADGTGQRPLTRVGVQGHFLRWTPDGTSIVFRCRCGGDDRTMQVPLDGGDPRPTAVVAGGSHISFSPDRSRIMDAVGHKSLWVSPLEGGEPEKVFAFEDPGVRIDYPVWSPDGGWVLFDRFRPQGGDIWVMSGLE